MQVPPFFTVGVALSTKRRKTARNGSRAYPAGRYASAVAVYSPHKRLFYYTRMPADAQRSAWRIPRKSTIRVGCPLPAGWADHGMTLRMAERLHRARARETVGGVDPERI